MNVNKLILLVSCFFLISCEGSMLRPIPQEIPPSIQGTWGIAQENNPEATDNCSASGDYFNQITITGNEIQFFETRAVLMRIHEYSDTRIRGTFDHQGLVETVEIDYVLDAKKNNQVLVKREYANGEAAGPSKYLRCN